VQPSDLNLPVPEFRERQLETKICTYCKVQKPLTEYSPSRRYVARKVGCRACELERTHKRYGTKPMLLPADRFWSYVQPVEGCWVWGGPIEASGYGFMGAYSGYVKAHRFSWTLHNGPISDGLFVLHTCDNPPCVNPTHLFLGTARDNSDDKHLKGRANPPRGEKHWRAVLTEDLVREIRRWPDENGRVLARRLGVPYSTMMHVRYGKSWKWVS
jgi:hypothetical protein